MSRAGSLLLLCAVAVLGYSLGTCDSHAQPIPIKRVNPGACWDVPGTPNPTFQCQNGFWQSQLSDGTIISGQGNIPAEYQAPPPLPQGPPAEAMFAPNFLFGGGAAQPPPIPGR